MKSIYIAGNNELSISPDSAIVSRGNPWFKPEDGADWRGKVLIGTCITRLGMHISEKFAERYYQNFIAAVHTYSHTADASVRWMRDGALVTGLGLVDAASQQPLTLTAADKSCSLNPASFKKTVDRAIAYVSSYITLKTGDFVLVDADIDELELTEGFDFDVKIGDTTMLHFKTR